MSHCAAGSKAAAELYPGPKRVLLLAEDLRATLETQVADGDRASLRMQIPSNTAEVLMQWLERGTVSTPCLLELGLETAGCWLTSLDQLYAIRGLTSSSNVLKQLVAG